MVFTVQSTPGEPFPFDPPDLGEIYLPSSPRWFQFVVKFLSFISRSFLSRRVCPCLPFLTLGFTSSLSDPNDLPFTRHTLAQLVLKNFSKPCTLRIDIPFGEISLGDCSSVLLCWRARFSSSLHSCLILVAAAITFPSSSSSPRKCRKGADAAYNAPIPESFYELFRNNWMEASLFAASARHRLLQPIIMEHTSLESLVIKDANGEGVLRMDRDQLEEMRKKPIPSSSDRTMAPAFGMWEWYAPVVELAGGVVLKEAILVAVLPRPSSCGEKADEGMGHLDWIKEEFDGDGEGMYAEAARMLVKKRRPHYMEIEPFLF